jgi:hypothetical protein
VSSPKRQLSQAKLQQLNSSLWNAVRAGDSDKAKRLLEKGADVNYEPLGGTPLSVATHRGLLGMVSILLKAGADVDGGDSDFTPLWHALNEDRTEIALLLLRFGAATSFAAFRTTAMEMAKRSQNQQLISALLAKPSRVAGARTPDFRIKEAQISMTQATRLLAALCGTEPTIFGGLVGSKIIRVPSKARFNFLEVHQEFLAKGFTVFGTSSTRLTHIAITKSTDKVQIIQRFGVSAPNHGLTPLDIATWLQRLDIHDPFYLLGLGHNFVRSRFKQPPKDTKALARSIHKFCPDVIDQGVGTVANAQKKLARDQEFFLWWD